MTKCPSCLSVVPDDESVCPSCGAEQKSGSTDPTLLESDTHNLPPPRAPYRKRKSSESEKSVSSFESLDGARFVPGTMLVGRYRIVGLLGRGGMGEVYRADDLKLSQTVALKFLPEGLADNKAALARFHREVRVARHVSHRNVCRVYDIGETDGHSFLSMEYVKGEELSSLLKRIGRLPHDKALEISRQLCAGLAAAHDNNVLHRDLKPANVMIDGEGNVRILDFGLAGIAEEFGEDELHAGTPAYMAPEQLAGKDVSKQSDIYSLGLVLYEVFTGKRAYEARSVNELLKLRQSATTPTNPSHIVKDIDPLVERVILQCLDHEASARPASAIQVAAMLPGGDPLAAALAAGETPSPEMVAAAPQEGVLRPAIAVSLVAVFFVLLAVSIWLSGRIMLYRRVPLDKSAEVLQERAREISRKAGYTDPPADSEYGFFTNYSYLDYVEETDKSSNRWDKLSNTQPPSLVFWYRQSPRYLEPLSLSYVKFEDPPAVVSGMTGTWLDTRGRLIHFYGVPLQKEATTSSGEPVKPDWSIFFKEAGLDILNFKPTESQWTPPHAYDTRAAWEGVYPQQPQIAVRVEAASYHGRPVYFELLDPWDKPGRQEQFGLTNRARALYAMLIGMLLSVVIGGVILAVRNLHLGRGDRKGAFRIALFILFVSLIETLFVHHVATFGEWNILMKNLSGGLLVASLFWVLYVAIEPFVRRRWPGRIISWTRLIAGDFRNPLVGRDILIGAAIGMALIAIQAFAPQLPGWFGWPSAALSVEPASERLGLRYAIPSLTNQIGSGFLFGFGFLSFLLLLSIILRKERLAIGALWLIASVTLILAWGHPLAFFVGPIYVALMLLPLVRYGLLAMISSQFFHHIWIFYPMTFEITSWYAGSFLIGLIASVAVLFYAFYISLAGQPIFRGGFLED